MDEWREGGRSKKAYKKSGIYEYNTGIHIFHHPLE